MSDITPDNARQADALTSPFQIVQITGNAWLESLLPRVHEVLSIDSYKAVFGGTSFVISSSGRFVTARHIAKQAADNWNDTWWESAPNRANAGVPFLPGAYPIRIRSMDLYTESEGTFPDLAVGNLEMPAAPCGQLKEMPRLELSSTI